MKSIDFCIELIVVDDNLCNKKLISLEKQRFQSYSFRNGLFKRRLQLDEKSSIFDNFERAIFMDSVKNVEKL